MANAQEPPDIQTLEIHYSPFSLIVTTLGGFALVVLSGLVAFRIFPSVKPGSLQEFAGYFGLIFFSLGSAIGIRRLYSIFTAPQDPVVVLTPTGIRDSRVAKEEIPWRAVRAVKTVTIRRQNILVLSVDPEVEAKLTLTRSARWSRPANLRLGIDGLCIAAQTLKINHHLLSKLVDGRVRQAQGLVSA